MSARFPVYRALLPTAIACFMMGCASTPTVEQVNAQNAKMEEDCKAKGYKPGTRDFDTCRSLAIQAEAQTKLDTMTAASMGIFGLTLLSDARAKRDITPLGALPNGLPLYRFRYRWSDQLYVGVMAQDVLAVIPDAVERGADGYLRVDYARLGVRLVTWDQWSAQSEPIQR